MHGHATPDLRLSPRTGAEHHHLEAGTKLYCLLTEARHHQVGGQSLLESNWRPVARKSSAVTTTTLHTGVHCIKMNRNLRVALYVTDRRLVLTCCRYQDPVPCPRLHRGRRHCHPTVLQVRRDLSTGARASQRRTAANVRDWPQVWLASAGRQRGRVANTRSIPEFACMTYSLLCPRGQVLFMIDSVCSCAAGT